MVLHTCTMLDAWDHSKCKSMSKYNILVFPAKRQFTEYKLHGLSPQANYTDRATAACRRSDCQLVRIEGATWSVWRIPPAVFLGFLDRSRYFSIKQLISCTHEAECTPFQTHYWICNLELWPLDHRGGHSPLIRMTNWITLNDNELVRCSYASMYSCIKIAWRTETCSKEEINPTPTNSIDWMYLWIVVLTGRAE
jgi:hypothetical protein